MPSAGVEYHIGISKKNEATAKYNGIPTGRCPIWWDPDSLRIFDARNGPIGDVYIPSAKAASHPVNFPDAFTDRGRESSRLRDGPRAFLDGRAG